MSSSNPAQAGYRLPRRPSFFSRARGMLSSNDPLEQESTRIDVTIKINRMQIGGILAGFERFNLHVKASFNEQVYFDTLKERYDSLINYLNV